MKQKVDKQNSLTKLVSSWKQNQGMISLSFDELQKEVKDKDVFISEKIDGELNGMQFNGKESKFATKDGRLRWDMPVLKEVTKIFKNYNVKDAIIYGELAKVSIKGHPVNFNDTMSAIVKPDSTDEEDHIHFFPFEFYELNGEKVSKTYDEYKKSFALLQKWFKNAKHIFPVDSFEGKEKDLKSAWKKYVEKEKNEGIVVRSSNNKIYKSKPIFTLDLGVIAIEEGTGKNKGTMGALILGLYDGDNFYKVVNLGVGFDDQDRDTWWKLAQKNKIKIEDRMIWVDPFKLNKVIETQYHRLNYRLVDTFEFKDKDWKQVDSKFAVTISQPNFIRIREDKTVNKNDLRLTQIPDFYNKKKKLSNRTEMLIIATIDNRLKVLQDLIKTQTSDGNWNYDPYMHGMANGMIMSEAIIEDKEPKFLDAPEKWLKDAKISEKIIADILDNMDEWLKDIKQHNISEEEAKEVLKDYNKHINLNSKEQMIIDLAEKHNILSD
jgi:hypothetical protein